jgi:hypothetical protein
MESLTRVVIDHGAIDRAQRKMDDTLGIVNLKDNAVSKQNQQTC